MSEGFYTPENDVTETLPDGRTVLVAAKGVPVPMDQARQRGLLKDAQQAGPSETKDMSGGTVEAPAEAPVVEQPEQQAEATNGTKSRTAKSEK